MTVQVLLTLFWHVGSGLPACWRLAPSYGSERNTALSMLAELPPDARVVGDGEYIGYPFWSAILESGRSFVIRVGGNVSLLKKLDPTFKRRGDVVHCWPDHARKHRQPPLQLRLIQLLIPHGTAWLLTNEFDLEERQVRELYQSRWGIEVFFRTLKQNWAKAKLSCRTPDNVTTELNWTLLGIWASLFVAKQALKGGGIATRHLSPTKVLDVLAESLTATALGLRPLALLLTGCVKADERHRTTSKASRNYPRKKKPRQCGKPKIKTATPAEVAAALAFI